MWQTWKVLLVAFASVLFAIFLRAVTDWVQARTRLSGGWAYFVTVVGLSALIGLAAWQLAPRAINQFAQIADVIPKSLEQARANLDKYDWGRQLVSFSQRAFASLHIGTMVASLASHALEWLADIAVVIAVGFFIGVEPDTYKNAVLRLFPPAHRDRAREVFDQLGYTMRWWIIGQVFDMAILGVATMIGLWIMGVPLAFTLGLFTGVMIFIPYLGALMSEVPAALVGLLNGVGGLVSVLALYLGIHILEAYVITPLVQRRTVRLPPALTIIAQVFALYLAGIPGMAVATPLTACALVLVKVLYLGEKHPNR